MLLQSLLVYKDGDSARIALYRVLGVSDGDTIDVAEDFKKVNVAEAVQHTSAIAEFEVSTSISGTVITISGIGLSKDAVNVLVSGGAA